ncbi:MAG TPA: HAMP domain-containing protein, partial [Propionibacteriaceae bacterium]|nr:HAMP domain-containing protein [Propionibacteriaceae bacterium]
MVAAAMAVTMIGVALVVGPPLFAQHMHEAGHGEQETVLVHAEEAFRTAGLVSLAVGLLISAVGAALISILITRRIGRSLGDLTTAAQRIASGDYEHRVADASLSTELSQLAGNFNDMAATLASTEGTRRRLLTDLAHELRTPIATIEICLDSLEDGIIDAGPETLAILRSQTGRLTRLTHDLRDVSAAEEGRLNLRLEPSDPVELVRRAQLAARDGFAQKGVAVHAAPSPSTLPSVDADPARIGQVLANLLS